MSVADIFETMAYGPAPESAAPALEWLERHAPALHLVIENRSVPPRTGEYFESVNPATGRPLIKIAQAGAPDVDEAGGGPPPPPQAGGPAPTAPRPPPPFSPAGP